MDSTGTTPASVTTASGSFTSSTFPSSTPFYSEFPFPSSTSSSPWEPEKMPPLSQSSVEARVRSLSSTVLAAPTHLPDWVMPEVLPDDNASTVITAITAVTAGNASLSLNEYINGTLSEVEEMEYPADDFDVQVAMTIIYAVICLAGIVGNVATCIVISRNRIMHTATNYYLFSMAISDLLLLVTGFPHEMHSIWLGTPYRFGETFCIIRGLAAETSTNASILTITMFTVERYIGICHPIRSHTMSKLGRVVKFVMGIWVLAGVCAVPQCVQYGLVYKLNPDNTTNYSSLDCVIKNPLSYSFEISTCLFFVVPMTLITVLYVKIGLTLKRSTALGRAASALSGRNVGSASTERRKNKAVVKMLVAVVVAFFICWAPFHAQRLLALYGDSRNSVTVIVYDVLTYASGILFYVSATINPILYHIMSKRFRQALKCHIYGRERSPQHWHGALSVNIDSRLTRKNTLESCYGTKYGSNGGTGVSIGGGGIGASVGGGVGGGGGLFADGDGDGGGDEPGSGSACACDSEAVYLEVAHNGTNRGETTHPSPLIRSLRHHPMHKHHGAHQPLLSWSSAKSQEVLRHQHSLTSLTTTASSTRKTSISTPTLNMPASPPWTNSQVSVRSIASRSRNARPQEEGKNESDKTSSQNKPDPVADKNCYNLLDSKDQSHHGSVSRRKQFSVDSPERNRPLPLTTHAASTCKDKRNGIVHTWV
ncbi:neurotensin receptor type 1-like [Oratosquilla oratoria]|uniref:neurotensin receptor type 1-like n=1 Tax=Oratosquilla oratoria TaxID=337810 RepID=UPI003F761DDF